MARCLLPCFVCLLFAATAARAKDVRFIFPAKYSDCSVIKSLLASKALADAGLVLKPQELTEASVLHALKAGEADMGVFTLSDSELRDIEKASPQTSMLARPFMFKSSDQIFLMQKSFIGDAAAADTSRTGLFPLQVWTHAITYFLTKEPVHDAADFSKLVVAAEYGSPDVKVLAAVGVKTVGGVGRSAAMDDGANAMDTELGKAAEEFAANYNGKLYLTTGWPQAGMAAATPGFWLQLNETEKRALKTAAEEARQVGENDVMKREAKIRQMPNVVINHIDERQQFDLAMRAGGGGEGAMQSEMSLGRKAEAMAQSKAAAAAAPAAPPPMAAMANSPVFFATDRDDEGTLDYATRFGAHRTDSFDYTCGFLGSPPRHSGEPKLPPAPKTLDKGVERCARLIVDRTRAAGMKKILFGVHGFNTSFEGLAWRALQLGSDLNYDGAIVGWSWPSEGSAFGYAYDEDSNAWSEPHFVEFLSAVAAAGPEMQLDFIAHSMGGRILLQALRELAQARSQIRIGAAVFAAPDVAQDVFREQIRIARKIGVIRTLYASEYDRAILISQSYHGAPRAGSGGASILVVNGVESVDARLSGHSYVFDEPKAILDLRKIVNRESAAAARGLKEREKAGATYWVIEP